MLQYVPKGRTGNGRCQRGKCGQGRIIDGNFVHDGKLGRSHLDGPRGPGALKEKNSYPVEWTRELLRAALAKNTTGARVVVDLFSGWQSMKSVCEELGLHYIGVDIMGNRNQFIRHAVASTCGSSCNDHREQRHSNDEGNWEDYELEYDSEGSTAVCSCGENPEFRKMFCTDTCVTCLPCALPAATEEVKTVADVCRCMIKCAPAGSDTAHGSHGFNCNRSYKRWDTARRMK